MKTWTVLFLSLMLPLSSRAFSCDTQGDILEVLRRCLSQTAVTEMPSTDPSYRQFDISFAQPVDHLDSSKGTFKQRLVLMHHGLQDPMVLQTSGYRIFTIARTGITQTFQTNQLQVEHRFFASSKPATLDWSQLNITQSAADFHRITTAFKKIYGAKWVNTGASKGGMTSIYHRFFYPEDLDGTVADVAPLSFSQSDERYIQFVDAVGGENFRDCRAKLEKLQVALLQHKEQIVATLAAENYQYLGGPAAALEHAVIEMPFAFWQYGSPTDFFTGCNQIPAPEASSQKLFAYLQAVNEVSNFGDSEIADFMPYYFQAATELGGPAAKLDHLAGLRQFEYNLDMYTPKGVPYSYSNESMHKVADWVQREAKGIIFVYGEYDPWTAGAFPASQGEDMHAFLVPAGNHSSNIFKLPKQERQAAKDILTRWLGKTPVANPLEKSMEPSRVMQAEKFAAPTLEELEFTRLQKKHRRLP